MRDDQMPAGGTDHSASTAAEFWGLISPLKDLFGFHGKPIYRGQGNAEWKLEPSILRNNDHQIYSSPMVRTRPDHSDRQIFAEVDSLATFARYCDDGGLRIPGDSIDFRDQYLDARRVTDSFIFQPRFGRHKSTSRLWPSPSIMAFPQGY